MASSYSTDLKLELMATGENSGTWGDKTNSNLNLIQQAIAGFESIAITSTNTTLVMTDATISNARNAVLKFTGAITANCTVFVASGIEKTYILENGTTGNFTVALNQVGGASAIFAGTDKSNKLVYLNGTDVVDLGLVNLQGTQTLTNKTLTSPTLSSPTINNGTANTIILTSPIINQINDANSNEQIKFTATASAINEFTVTNAATGNAPEISATGGDTNIDLKITPKGSGKINLDGIKFPNADGTANQVLKTDGSGTLSFTTINSYTNSDALTLFNASGSAPVYACRAWVNFQGTDTVAIRASGNVSSITDNGTGRYTANFNTAMSDVNYAAQCTSGLTGSPSGASPEVYGKTSNFLTTSVGADTRSATGGVGDQQVVCISVFR